MPPPDGLGSESYSDPSLAGSFYLDRNERGAILNREVIKSWSADLPATDDYSEREEVLDTPDGLPKGLYYLIASHKKNSRPAIKRILYSTKTTECRTQSEPCSHYELP